MSIVGNLELHDEKKFKNRNCQTGEAGRSYLLKDRDRILLPDV